MLTAPRTYKIAIIGTHGTGKSSLCTLVKGELQKRGIPTTTLLEAATKAREKGFPINKDTTIEAQLYISYYQCCQELIYHQDRSGLPNFDVVITDRGPDNYCYLAESVGENEYALSIIRSHMHLFPYSQIYLLPIVNHNITKGEGIRDMRTDFRLRMDKRIRSFLNEENIRYTELPMPDSNDRYREGWVRVVINRTLRDLGKSEEELME